MPKQMVNRKNWSQINLLDAIPLPSGRKRHAYHQHLFPAMATLLTATTNKIKRQNPANSAGFFTFCQTTTGTKTCIELRLNNNSLARFTVLSRSTRWAYRAAISAKDSNLFRWIGNNLPGLFTKSMFRMILLQCPERGTLINAPNSADTSSSTQPGTQVVRYSSSTERFAAELNSLQQLPVGNGSCMQLRIASGNGLQIYGQIVDQLFAEQFREHLRSETVAVELHLQPQGFDRLEERATRSRPESAHHLR